MKVKLFINHVNTAVGKLVAQMIKRFSEFSQDLMCAVVTFMHILHH